MAEENTVAEPTTGTSPEDRMAAEKAAFESVVAARTQGEPEVAASTEEPAENVAPEAETPSNATTFEVPSDFEQRARWDNIPQKIIDVMKEDPEAVQAYYDRAKLRHDRTDALFHERDELERAKAELERKRKEPEQEQPAGPPRLVDLLGDKADLLDPGVVEALEAAIDARTAAATPQVEPQPVNRVDPELMRAIDAEVEANRVRLQELFPEARLDGAEWDLIASKADQEIADPIYQSPVFQNMGQQGLLRHVFDLTVRKMYPGIAPQPSMRETTTPSGPAARNTAASSPSLNAEKSSNLSPKEIEEGIMAHLKRHPGDMDGARAAYGLSPLKRHPRFSHRVNTTYKP